jgi:RNA polymerase sigma-70 factor (ECF subfamily)
MSIHELRVFYDDHYRDVVGAVTLVTGSRVIAEDAVNEAVARAWERCDGIQQRNRWVLTVALNVARNRWRRTRREVSGREASEGAIEPADPALIDLRLALRALPVRQREVVVLHYLLDLPVAEVEEWLRLSPGGVKHALFRARRSLADVLTIEEVS